MSLHPESLPIGEISTKKGITSGYQHQKGHQHTYLKNLHDIAAFTISKLDMSPRISDGTGVQLSGMTLLMRGQVLTFLKFGTAHAWIMIWVNCWVDIG